MWPQARSGKVTISVVQISAVSLQFERFHPNVDCSVHFFFPVPSDFGSYLWIFSTNLGDVRERRAISIQFLLSNSPNVSTVLLLNH